MGGLSDCVVVLHPGCLIDAIVLFWPPWRPVEALWLRYLYDFLLLLLVAARATLSPQHEAHNTDTKQDKNGCGSANGYEGGWFKLLEPLSDAALIHCEVGGRCLSQV